MKSTLAILTLIALCCGALWAQPTFIPGDKSKVRLDEAVFLEEALPPQSISLQDDEAYIRPVLSFFNQFDAFAKQKVGGMSGLFIVAKVKYEPSVQGEAFLPLMFLDMFDKKNVKLRPILAGKQLLELIHIRLDRIDRSYLQLYFFEITDDNYLPFTQELMEVESYLHTEIERFQRVAGQEVGELHKIHGIWNPAAERDFLDFKRTLVMLDQSSNLMDQVRDSRNQDMILNWYSKAYSLIPLSAKPEQIMADSILITRNGAQINLAHNFPMILADLRLTTYWEIAGLPSSVRISSLCDDIPEQTLRNVALTMGYDSEVLTIKQRELEKELFNMMQLYHQYKANPTSVVQVQENFNAAWSRLSQLIDTTSGELKQILSDQYLETARQLQACIEPVEEETSDMSENGNGE